MGALIDLAGRTYGRLTVKVRLRDAVTPSGARQPVWGCVCACGRATVEQGRALRAGRALSCRECVRDPSRMLKYGTTYLVWWPTLGILKIGRAFKGSRLEQMRQTGAIVLADIRETDDSWESAGLRALRELFDPAFTGPTGTGPHRADKILYRGRGWSECFFVDVADLQLAYDTALRAMFREGNDFGINPPATPTWRRALAGIQRARAAHRGRPHSRGPAHPPRAAEGPAAGPAAPRFTAVPVRTAEARHGADHPAHPDARGGGTRPHLGAARPRMDLDARPARSAHEHPAGHRSPLTCTDPRRARRGPIFTGWGEREGKRGSASTSARASASAGGRRGPGASGTMGGLGSGVRHPAHRSHPAGTSPAAECSAHRMSGSPHRISGALWTLRHRNGTSNGVEGTAAVSGAVDGLRGVAGQ